MTRVGGGERMVWCDRFCKFPAGVVLADGVALLPLMAKALSKSQIATLAIQWAQEPQRCQPSYWALRLAIARRFAQFWLPYDSRTEIPPPEYFGPLGRRRAVHIYSPDQVGALLKASAQLGRAHSVRAATFRTVVGLLECTGLRIGEALGLSDEDIDWSAEVLTIRHAKGGQTRLVPVQSSTMEALRYRCLRRKAFGRKAGPRFFVNSQGTPLGYFGVNRAFHQLRRALGWTHGKRSQMLPSDTQCETGCDSLLHEISLPPSPRVLGPGAKRFSHSQQTSRPAAEHAPAATRPRVRASGFRPRRS
jgi:integrase